MKISTKGRYGLRALIDVAVHSEKEASSISAIATRENLSESYLEQLMAKLKKAGLVTSIRGAQGGYILAKPADEISVGDILRALEGDLTPVDCPEIIEDGACSGADICVTKYVWKKINDSINQTVDEMKLSALLEESKKKNETVQNCQCDK